MSIQQNFPAISPSLSLNFARSKTLDPRITFTRTSSATRVNGQGLVEVVPANSARFDHSFDPVSGTVKSLGLLVEEARTNHIINSENLSLWTSSVNMIPTGNAILLPNGNISTAVEYRGETTEANVKLLRPSPSGSGVTAGDTWVFSVFLRAGTEQTCHLALLDRFNSGSTGRTFDMVNGVFLATQGYAGTVSEGQTGVEKYPNGWYKVWISAVFTVGEPQGHQIYLRLNANSGSIPLTTSFSAWGAQLEKASFPTSYIPTTASTATRTADNASMVGENFSSWYNQSEGTMVAQGKRVINVTDFSRIVSFNDNSSLNILSIYTEVNKYQGFKVINGSQNFFAGPTIVNSMLNQSKVALSHNTTNATIVTNGIFTGEASISGTALVTRMTIGVEWYLVGYYNGTISQLTYYPKRLSNTQLQTLTR